MNRRQSLDKPAILSPPVQFIVPSPTASASPSPRLNCSPNTAAVQLQQSPQHRNLLSDVVVVTNPHDITARRLSTGSNPATAAAAAGGTILLRQSPSPHNIIFTNGPATTTTSVAMPTGHEFNTTLVGSNNIALNVKRGNGNGGGIGNSSSGGGTMCGGFTAVHSGQGSKRGGNGGASPKPGKRPVTMMQSSPVPSPMASPTAAIKQTTPNQSPIHHHQIPILTSHATTVLGNASGGGAQPMYQLIQTSAGTQQLIQTSGTATGVHRPVTFTTPNATFIQQAAQPVQIQHAQQQVKSKAPQQILPKPATGIGTNAPRSVTPTSSSNGSGTTLIPPLSTQTILAGNPSPTPATANASPAAPIQLLPTAQQPHQLIMSANQMPMLVQQNTPQGVQFILRQPTAPLIMAQPTAATATVANGRPQTGTATSAGNASAGQPQPQLLRIVNSANGQVQFTPATTTFIMSSQGNLIQQIQGPTTTTPQPQQQQQQQQIKGHATSTAAAQVPTSVSGSINGSTLVQMSTGQFISQFPAQNFNFVNNVNQLVATGGNVTFSAQTGADAGANKSGVAGTATSATSAGGTIHFNSAVMHPPIQIHPQQQIISPIASPAPMATAVPVTTLPGQPQQQQTIGDLSGMVIVQQQTPTAVGKSVVMTTNQTQQQAIAVKPKKEKKESKKAVKPQTKSNFVTKSAPVIVTKTPTPPPAVAAPQPQVSVVNSGGDAGGSGNNQATESKGKLDLANVMKLCGIGIDDDDDEEEMLIDNGYEHPPPPPPEDDQHHHHQQQPEATYTTSAHHLMNGECVDKNGNGSAQLTGESIMITIPGVDSGESIPISFSIPTSSGPPPLAPTTNAKAQTLNSSGDVITLDDSWSPQKMQSSTPNVVDCVDKPLTHDNMCVDTFVNSVLDSQMTPTLQSQIAEIQNQLLGVSSELSSSANNSKSTAIVTPSATTTTTIVMDNKTVSPVKMQPNSISPTKKTVIPVAKPKQSKKQNGSTVANKKQNATVKVTKESPKANSVPMVSKVVTSVAGSMQMTMPSQIGNIQISQVDSSNTKPMANKVATTIENQIQITPIMDTKSTTPVLMTQPGGIVTGAAVSTVASNMAQAFPSTSNANMTVTMKTVAQPPLLATQIPKLQPTLVQNRTGPTIVQNAAVMPATMQINLQAPNAGIAMALQQQQQQHPLLSQLTGALSLNLMDDGRLVLKHDASQPQDAQSQMILQTILSGALPNLTLINETKTAPAVVAPQPIIDTAPVKAPPGLMVNQKIVQQPAPTQVVRKAIVEPQPQQPPAVQQQIVMAQGNIVELPKIGADKQLFKMNMSTNQITQISAGATTALVGPMEQLLIVPADINPQQLAQCQAAGQLQLHNMGHLKPTTTPQQSQIQPQVQLKPQLQMPGLVNSSTGAPLTSKATAPVTTNPTTTTKKVTTIAHGNKKGGKAGTATEVAAKVTPHTTNKVVNQVKPQQQVLIVHQQSGKGNQMNSKTPILKSNATVAVGKAKGAENTAVVRPNTIQSGVVKVTGGGAGGNKVTLMPGQQAPTQIMQNLQKNTQIVLPVNAVKNQPIQPQPVPQSQPPPRVQTIQLTPQNQQLLKEVQVKIQILSGKLKDKNLLETLTFSIELDENNPINRQPLPTLQNCNTMTDKDIQVALQRLFIEQQKILATGKVIPTISNFAPPQPPPQTNVMHVPPTVMANKIQLPSTISGDGAGATAEMVKNWTLMKTQQINEMTIKPIIGTSSTSGVSLVPNKVINSTTIIPAPVSLTGSNQPQMSAQLLAKKVSEMPGAMSITPVVAQPTGVTGLSAMSAQKKGQMQGQQMKSVIGLVGNNVGNKTQVVTSGLIPVNRTPTTTTTTGNVKIEKVGSIGVENAVKVVIKEEKVDAEVVVKEEEKGKSAQELAEITKRITDRLKYDQECCTKPDTETPFRGKADAVMRLFGYHCNYREFEPECPEDEIKFQEAAVSVQEGLWSLRQRFQGLLMNGSMLEVATSERVMMERYLKSDLEEEIKEIKAEIERLKNPSPPPPPTPIPVPVPEVVVPEERATELVFKSLAEDETTRTSEATDSRSLCDLKSENARFGFDGDWSDEDELDEVGAEDENSSRSRMTSSCAKKEVDVKNEHVMSSGFDIESEILPNFILNMKKSDDHDLRKAEEVKEAVAPEEPPSKLRKTMISPAVSVKSEGYDEWKCIQKELASMRSGGLGSMHSDCKTDFDSLKKPWMGSQEVSMHQESNLNIQMNSQRVEVAVQQHKQTVTVMRESNSFFPSLDHSNQSATTESWLDFQHNNNSFDFPMTTQHHATGATSTVPTVSTMSSVSGGQIMNGMHGSLGGNQKRSWNGMSSDGSGGGGGVGGALLNGIGGQEGGVDDFYSKKMCYGNGGDFDFNQLMGNTTTHHHQEANAYQGNGGSAVGVGSGGSMNGLSMGMEHGGAGAGHANFDEDEDISRQVASAIDSILQGSEGQDFHFNLDPAMGALLGTTGDSNSSVNHNHMGPGNVQQHQSMQMHGGVGSGSGMMGVHHGDSSMMMNSRFGLNAGGGGMGGMVNHHPHQNSNHHPHHQAMGVGDGLSNAMILSEDDDEDEQQRAIKSVLLS